MLTEQLGKVTAHLGSQESFPLSCRVHGRCLGSEAQLLPRPSRVDWSGEPAHTHRQGTSHRQSHNFPVGAEPLDPHSRLRVPPRWAHEAPEAHWPQVAEPSPIVAFALDGVPIYGPYGEDGLLVDVQTLDECSPRLLESCRNSSLTCLKLVSCCRRCRVSQLGAASFAEWNPLRWWLSDPGRR